MTVMFKTTLLKDQEKNATGISVPMEVMAALGTQKKPKVTVSINGYTYRTTVAAYVDVFMLPVSTEHREAAGVKAGDQIEVTLALDLEPRLVTVPDDLAAALTAQPGATAAFDALSYSARKEHARQVEEAKTEETRKRRIAIIVAQDDQPLKLLDRFYGWQDNSKTQGVVIMTENTEAAVNAESQPSPYLPNPALRSLDVLVGTWHVSGPDIDGQVRFEWMEGGFFLVQYVDMVHSGHTIKGMEIIGFDHSWDAMSQKTDDSSSQDITSHLYDNAGNTFTYTWEITEDTLTIWGGPKGSPSYYKGAFSADHNSNSGRWVWPGGGYESAMTRVK